MKAIHADPREVRKIFSDTYIIPDFQRPYSWTVEPCDKLWEDFIDFYYSKESKEDKYFLGNIVIHPHGDSFSVIDGQQRLTTLLLLIKNLHSRAGTVKALEECLKVKDPLTSELTNSLRIDSFVLEKDKEYLYDIVFNNGNNTSNNSNFKVNYNHFSGLIDKWWINEGQSAEKLNDLILTLLDQIVLLPIHCGSEDDALTIFETINNRGMSLTDADIFKAKLHHSAANDKDEFVKQWKGLENHEWLFRILMHINRAKDGDYGKEIALRSYFTAKDKGRLSDWKSIINSLQLIQDIESNWKPTDDVNILWNILYTYPNYYWNYPLFVFLHKYGTFEDSTFYLSENYEIQFAELIETTLKYFFIKGVVYNSVNAVKDTVFKVCVAIEKEDDYLGEYFKNISDNDLIEFDRRIKNNQCGRYLRGLVLLSAYLNPNQDKTNYNYFIREYNFHIEHILPKKWNNYDGWTETSWDMALNTLGNLVPLECRLNISAKNEFFDKKKEYYKDSLVQDAKDLMDIEDWNPDTWNANQIEKQSRILNFFKIIK